MKYRSKLRHLLILGCFLICPLVSRAQDQTTGFQVSLFNPVQLHPDGDSVDAFRLDLIYGVNKDVQGIDIGIVNKALGSARGFELGVVNEVQRDFKGVQFGLIANLTTRSFEGFQAAVFYNDAGEELHGLQLGIVNHTGSLNGVQIGILNFNDDTKYLGFFPFINAAF